MKRTTALLLCVLLIPALCLSFDEKPVVIFHDMACIKPKKDYVYQTCHSMTISIDHFLVQVPNDFDTDLASIPRWLWFLIAPTRSDIIAPAILHDFLYACHFGYTRPEADEIFYSALIGNGVSNFRASEMYYAVRIFGGKHYSEVDSCYKHLALK